MEKLKVLVVDHSVMNRKKMTDIVNDTDYGQAIRSASNGQIALEWLLQCSFDVILMDVYVVKEIGPDKIREIKLENPGIEIIIMSDRDSESAQLTLESMNQGALDFIMRSEENKAEKEIMVIKSELEAVFTQIKVKQYLPVSRKETVAKAVENTMAVKKEFRGEIDLVLIASSTGGPVALEMVCKELGADFPKPILIVQHMPPEYTQVLATSLNKKFKPVIMEGKQGDVVKRGQLIIAPGGFHMALERNHGEHISIKLLETPFVNGVKPAADVLFQSVAEHYKGRNILVAILTGMGNDGVKGVSSLKEACNCYCLTQSENSCVVYGMPKCVFDAGLSDEVVDLKNIGNRLNEIVINKGGTYGQ